MKGKKKTFASLCISSFFSKASLAFILFTISFGENFLLWSYFLPFSCMVHTLCEKSDFVFILLSDLVHSSLLDLFCKQQCSLSTYPKQIKNSQIVFDLLPLLHFLKIPPRELQGPQREEGLLDWRRRSWGWSEGCSTYLKTGWGCLAWTKKALWIPYSSLPVLKGTHNKTY